VGGGWDDLMAVRLRGPGQGESFSLRGGVLRRRSRASCRKGVYCVYDRPNTGRGSVERNFTARGTWEREEFPIIGNLGDEQLNGASRQLVRARIRPLRQHYSTSVQLPSPSLSCPTCPTFLTFNLGSAIPKYPCSIVLLRQSSVKLSAGMRKPGAL